MEVLKFKSNTLVESQNMAFKRSLYHEIDWSNRLIGILGARGTGKTTLLLQKLKESFFGSDDAVYLSLDDVYFAQKGLTEVMETFRLQGTKYFFLDEVHKYPNWHREIKNIYDFNRDIYLYFTGSSIVDMLRLPVDLSRRALIYDLPGLSFREFIEYNYGKAFPKMEISHFVSKHVEIAGTIVKEIKPIKLFQEYLSYGYYPYFKENILSYHIRLEKTIRLIIEYDLAFLEHIDYQNIWKVFQLLGILAEQVPFTPNIKELSEKLGMGRNTLIQYLNHLEKAKMINMLNPSGKGLGKLAKPGKIVLENPNLFKALSNFHQDIGSLRESFFVSQVKNAGYSISLPRQGDFHVDHKYIIEVGGRQKGFKQIADISDSYIAADDLEIGSGKKIPLWLFGFLY
jgi:uncharacterized protein